MKLEILAKRLATRCDTPILEAVILGTEPIGSLPVECMIWRGTTTAKTHQPRKGRKWLRDGLAAYTWMTRPYALIKHERRRLTVHRLIYQLLHKPTEEYQLRATCDNVHCINPRHWSDGKSTLDYETIEEPPEIGDWTDADVEELVDILLTEHSPKNWQDVIEAPLMEDVPPQMLRAVLLRFGKGHLCCVPPRTRLIAHD